jgi:hypothetical protein
MYKARNIFYVVLGTIGCFTAPRDACANLVTALAEPADVAASADSIAAELDQKNIYSLQLEQELDLIDAELVRCKNAKNNWKIATVLGSVGTAATGGYAIWQGTQISKAKRAGLSASKPEDNAKEQAGE